VIECKKDSSPDSISKQSLPPHIEAGRKLPQDRKIADRDLASRG
jgi:hypothetical protein